MLCSLSYFVSVVLYSLDIFSHIVSVLWGFNNLHKINKKKPHSGITIIKPLKGNEVGLRDNLVTHFALNDSKLQILLCFASESDPGIATCRQVIQDYPHVDAKIIITRNMSQSLNPLVANVSSAFSHAKYNLIWVTTSRIMVSDSIMDDLAGKAMDPHVGIAHQIPYTTGDGSSLSSVTSTVYFGSYGSRWCIFTHVMGINTFIGMSYMFEKHKLENICTFEDFGGFINEDIAFSECLIDNGFKNIPSTFLALQNISHFTLNDNLQRLVRWNKMRIHSHFMAAVFLEFLCIAPILSIFVAYIFPVGYGHWGALGHVVFSIVMDYASLCVSQNGWPRFGILSFVCGWFAREIGFIVITLTALYDPNTVEWGGNVYRIFGRGNIELIG